MHSILCILCHSTGANSVYLLTRIFEITQLQLDDTFKYA